MWTLFGSSGSGSAAVEAALVRCGQPFRTVVASTWEPGSAQRELLRANPLGQIPTLQFDDVTVMTESAAILIHLGLAFPDSGLLPAEPAARAQALRGLVYIASNCYAAIGVNDYPERWLPAASEAHRKALQAGARARLHRLWEIFADQFPAPDAPDFFAGARPGALDLLAAVVSRWSGTRAHLKAHRPALAALVQRVDSDAEFSDLFQTHWPAPAA